MADVVGILKDWFYNKLDEQEQKEVLDFLYGGKVLLQEGRYCGPRPGFCTKGLFTGPAPMSMSTSTSIPRCPTCGKPL